MDKNTAIGLVLIVLVFIGFTYWGQPSKEEQERYKRQQDSIELAKQHEADANLKAAQQQKALAAAAAADTNSVLFAARNGKEQDVVLKNSKVELTLSTKGGVFKKAVLKNYKDQQGNADLTLLDAQKGETTLNFAFTGKEENIRTNELFFTPVNTSDSTATLRIETAKGHIDFNYTLNEYMVSLDIQAVGMDGFFAPSTKSVSLEWMEMARQQEKGYTFENQRSSLTYKEKDSSSDYLSETKDDAENPEESLDWIAFKNQFFSYVMIGQQDLDNVKLESKLQNQNSGYLKQYKANMETKFDATGKEATKLQFYIGPNDFKTLQAHNDLSNGKKDLDLEELVYLGWPLIRWINRFFTLYVFDWLTSWGINMGIVLLLITLLLKAITYPLVKKSYMSSAKMRVLKPKMDEINEKYKDNDNAMMKQQEMMALYSKYGVSPMGGCLPMLIQMPIWIAMFNFVPNAIQLRGESFLWADDLSTYDDVVNWGFHIIGIGDHLSLFCILFSATNLIYTSVQMKMQSNMPGQNEQMKMMKWMMYIMPVMFFFWFNDYSAGLSYYYFISLLFSVLITWVLRKTTNDEKLLAKLEKYYKENQNNPKKQSGMMARLQAMQEQLQEQQRMQQQNNRK